MYLFDFHKSEDYHGYMQKEVYMERKSIAIKDTWDLSRIYARLCHNKWLIFDEK